MKTYDKNNCEILDETPIAVPLEMKVPESVDAMMKRLINSKFSDLELANEYETFKEADDFNCDDDDFDFTSPWEEVFDPHTGTSLGFLEQNRYQPKEYLHDNDNFKSVNNLDTGETNREANRTDEDNSPQT